MHAAPPPASRPLPDFIIQSLPRPPVEDPNTGWARIIWYLGPTRHFSDLCIHSGVISGNVTPHALHTHNHEEAHITFSDFIQYTYADPLSGAGHNVTLGKNALFFFDSEILHNSRNAGRDPAQYLHLRWQKASLCAQGKPKVHFTCDGSHSESDDAAGSIELYGGPSRFLPRLVVRRNLLPAQKSVALRRNTHDTFIALFEGSVAILSKIIDAPGFAYLGANVPHNIINQTRTPAEFYEIELHHSK